MTINEYVEAIRPELPEKLQGSQFPLLEVAYAYSQDIPVQVAIEAILDTFCKA